MNANNEPVKLRQRTLASGKISLYLDTYSKGKRRYEYLNLYLLPETDRAAKLENKKIMGMAQAILHKRVEDFRSKRYCIDTPLSGITIHDYIDIYLRNRQMLAEGTVSIYRTIQRRLDSFSPGSRMEDIDVPFCERFKRHLIEAPSILTKKSGHLDKSSVRTIWLMFAAVLNAAFKEGVIFSQPHKMVPSVKFVRKNRVFLTVEEVRKLAATPCDKDIVRRSFLFSCLTGLRISDIMKMTWGEISQQAGYARITFRQKKTGGLEYLDINAEAAELMGERGPADSLVFKGVRQDESFNAALKIWVAKAGIDKPVTFHAGRHTFAVMMLEQNVSIYTVSKLLGHSSIATTQIYADIVDQTKRSAVDKIPSVLALD